MSRNGEVGCLDIEAGDCRTCAAAAGSNEHVVSVDEAASEEEVCRRRRRSSSCISDCSSSDLECGGSEIEVNSERDCRICHLGLVSNASESGAEIALGCSCKDDLAAAHKHCAETWFKIKGDKICEICGSTAKNVVCAGESESIEQTSETGNVVTTSAQPTETRSFWQGHRFLNFLLACMIFAFVISWLFHFNVPG